ncbi:MAG: thioredoxin domain-containing protein, partial [Pseudomonadota bacterium]|nr:thioredoxin domain-containing protein [Pseudomonadota bacterium]
ELTEAMLAHFEDPEEGGFFFTADDHETLLLRPKPGLDDAIPSGNGVAASLLVRLGHLLGEPRYLEAAERTFSLFGSELQNQPAAYGSLTLALEALQEPAPVIVIRGPASSLPRWQSRLAEHYTPGQVVLAIPADAPNLPGLLAERRPSGEMETTAYLCRGTHCRLPISGLEQLVEDLSAASP